MSVKKVIKKLKLKGNLNKQGVDQYIQVTYLPSTYMEEEHYPKKWGIEVGKVIEKEGETIETRPTSFRTPSKSALTTIVGALTVAYLHMGGNSGDLVREVRKQTHEYRKNPSPRIRQGGSVL